MAEKSHEFVSVELIAWLDVPNVVLIRIATVRYHPSGEGAGSKQTFSCTLLAVDDAGWLSAGAWTGEGKMPPEVFREIDKAMRVYGLVSVDFERRTRGKIRFRHLT